MKPPLFRSGLVLYSELCYFPVLVVDKEQFFLRRMLKFWLDSPLDVVPRFHIFKERQVTGG